MQTGKMSGQAILLAAVSTMSQMSYSSVNTRSGSKSVYAKMSHSMSNGNAMQKW